MQITVVEYSWTVIKMKMITLESTFILTVKIYKAFEINELSNFSIGGFPDRRDISMVQITYYLLYILNYTCGKPHITPTLINYTFFSLRQGFKFIEA